MLKGTGETHFPQLLDTFHKLQNAKFLVLDLNIFQILHSCLDQLSQNPCPFNNLKYLKIDTTRLKEKDPIPTQPIQVKDYLLENSPNATFILDLPQRPLEQLCFKPKSKVAKLEERIQAQNEVITEQKSIHERLLSHMINCRLEQLKLQVESGNPDFQVIRSIGCEIKSALGLIPESMRVDMKVRFLFQYIELKSLILTRIDGSQWVRIEIPPYLFSSPTLKHLTLKNESRVKYQVNHLSIFAWDLPVLETLNLSSTRIISEKSANFSMFANLKDLTLHRVYMSIDEINICCPQLSNLTITDVIRFPKVFKVIAPKLKNFTASATYHYDIPFECLQSTEGFYSLEKVNLFLSPRYKDSKIGVPALLSLFQKLRSAKFLILNSEIIETLGSNMNQLSHEHCPFYNLMSLKICIEPLSQKDRISEIAIPVRKYLLENSPNATFTITDLHQHYASSSESQKRPWEQLYKEAKYTVAKLEEKIKTQDKVIEEQKSIHEKMTLHLINSKLVELRGQIEGGKPDYKIIHLMVSEIRPVMDLLPKSLRLKVEAQFFSQYESLKSLFLTQIDASHWTKIETELGSIRHSKRARSTKI
ncbi:F-box domain, cyclin-like protein [Artemisia annua]|uniref:F-box domain, cyclin-like protein n=1 Tax=Artemisia annua TaxID=35608 RepID=A0A2U1N6Q9_ARTAN|nr:F-box domain, cyclin-like protein [Artemisia annua]